MFLLDKFTYSLSVLTPWDHSYILCHRSLWPFNIILISYNSWAITFSKLNCSCLYIPQLNFCHEIIMWPLPIREIGGPWSGSWNWCYEDKGMLWYDWWLLFFSYLFILENPKFLGFFLPPGIASDPWISILWCCQRFSTVLDFFHTTGYPWWISISILVSLMTVDYHGWLSVLLRFSHSSLLLNDFTSPFFFSWWPFWTTRPRRWPS